MVNGVASAEAPERPSVTDAPAVRVPAIGAVDLARPADGPGAGAMAADPPLGPGPGEGRPPSTVVAAPSPAQPAAEPTGPPITSGPRTTPSDPLDAAAGPAAPQSPAPEPLGTASAARAPSADLPATAAPSPPRVGAPAIAGAPFQPSVLVDRARALLRVPASRGAGRGERRVPALAPLLGLTWDDGPRPALVLDPPQAVDVVALLPDHPPKFFVRQGRRVRIARADGPERVHGEWWLHDDELWLTRDYFRAECRDGLRWWLFRASTRTEGLGHARQRCSPPDKRRPSSVDLKLLINRHRREAVFRLPGVIDGPEAEIRLSGERRGKADPAVSSGLDPVWTIDYRASTFGIRRPVAASARRVRGERIPARHRPRGR